MVTVTMMVMVMVIVTGTVTVMVTRIMMVHLGRTLPVMVPR